jgi:hypothetical protein
MTDASNRSAVPDVMLERYRLQELPPVQADAIARLAASDETIRRRLEALDQSDEDTWRSYPADDLARRIRQRAERSHPADRPVRGASFVKWAAAAAVVTVAAILVVAVPWTLNDDGDVTSGPATADTDTIKGLHPALVLYGWTSSGSRRLADGDTVHPGDLIRIGYVSAGRTFGLILSIDGRGGVTVHLPPDGQQAGRLQSSGTVLLDQSFELDDAPRWERFYFITGQQPFEVAPIVDAVRRAQASDPVNAPRLPLRQDLDQATFSLSKEAGR